MEAFDMATCLEDNLLDFGSDVGEGDEDAEKTRKSSKLKPPSLNPNRPMLENVEEELEWLSNKDAFPAVETSFVNISGDAVKQQSPVSVLDNSNSSSNSNSNSSGGTALSSGKIIVIHCYGSLKVPVKARSKHLRKCRDLKIQGSSWWVQALRNVNPKAKGPGSRTLGRKCHHCGTEKTPQWRAGPLGPKTLCNACGVRFKSGRLVPEYRPASSPTFSNELHSNSHKKVLEMRKQKLLRFSAMKPMEKG